MTLAVREITVEIGGEVIRLRPTLRAAMRLEREHGFGKLFRLLTQGSALATHAILAENVDLVPPVAVADIVRLAPKLEAYLIQTLDVGPKPKGKTSGKPVTLSDHFARLYQLGTGVLGWTPDDTWASSPHEILAAHEGRIEFVDQLLVAVFGTKDSDDADAPSVPNFTRDPDATAKLKALAR